MEYQNQSTIYPDARSNERAPSRGRQPGYYNPAGRSRGETPTRKIAPTAPEIAAMTPVSAVAMQNGAYGGLRYLCEQLPEYSLMCCYFYNWARSSAGS